MQRAQLGDTDLFVAPVAFGTSPLGGNFGRLSTSQHGFCEKLSI
jgi:aryl-alcohol dehydrogenase-like predicted oxidoreductase